MSHFKIGARLESLGLSLRKAIAQVPRYGIRGIMLDATGDFAPGTISATGQRELRNLLRSAELELIALGCPLRNGLAIAKDQQPRIEHIRNVMTLSYQLGAKTVIIQPGKVPESTESPEYALMTEALEDLSHFGDRTGAILALETGLESGQALADYLDRFDTGSLGVNLDPANLLLHGFDIYDSLMALKKWIVHTDAKDARVASASRAKEEVPLGHGDIDWMLWLSSLDAIGYKGWITLERESGDHRFADIAEGAKFLRRLFP